MLLLFPLFLLSVLSSSPFLELNTFHQRDVAECSESHFFNLTSIIPQTLVLNVEPVSGLIKVFKKFHHRSQIQGKNPSEWIPARKGDSQIPESKQFEGCGRLDQTRYLSVTVINTKCEDFVNMKYNLMASYGFPHLLTSQKLSTSIAPGSYFFSRLQQDHCYDITSYLIISAISEEKESQMFNFFVTQDSTLIPRHKRHDNASYYGNHLQLQSGAKQCNHYNLAIWNPGEEKLTVQISFASFSLSDQHRVIPAGAMYVDYTQHLKSQTYIFFNWSKEKTISINWRTQSRAKLFVDKALSEQEAKSITQVQGRTGSKQMENVGGDQEMLINSQDQLYCGYCFYVIEIENNSNQKFLIYSLMVSYGSTIQTLRLNEPVKRKIQSRTSQFLFEYKVKTDYKITVINNANDAKFSVIEDCRRYSDFMFPRVSGNSESVVFHPESKDRVGSFFCLRVEVEEEHRFLETYIEISTMHMSYSLMINGHESQVHYSLAQNETLRYFALPLGNGTHLQAEQIDVDLYLHHKKALPDQPTQFCIKLEGGFVDLSEVIDQNSLLQVDYLEKQEKWSWCTDYTQWRSYKFLIESDKLRNFKNAGLLFKLAIQYDRKPYFTSLSLELLASYNAVINLTPNADYANKLYKTEDSQDLYHLHIPAGLYATVEVMPCYGAVMLQIYESLKDIKHGAKYHTEVNVQNGRIEYQHSAKNGQEQIYLKVLHFDKLSQTSDFAEYRLRVSLTNEEMLTALYYAENYGKIKQNNKNTQFIGLSWGALKRRVSEGQDQEPNNIYYSVYFSSSGTLDMSSSCALQNYGMLRVTDLQDLHYEAYRPRRYRKDQKQMTYYVNVLATVPEIRETIPYQQTTITFSKAVEESDSHAYIYLIAIVLVLLFGVGVAFLLLMIRYKRTQERLYYEMQDVRNIAGIELTEFRSENNSDSRTPLEVEKEDD